MKCRGWLVGMFACSFGLLLAAPAQGAGIKVFTGTTSQSGKHAQAVRVITSAGRITLLEIRVNECGYQDAYQVAPIKPAPGGSFSATRVLNQYSPQNITVTGHLGASTVTGAFSSLYSVRDSQCREHFSFSARLTRASVFRGRTSQHLPVQMVLLHRRILQLTAGVSSTCVSTGGVSGSTSTPFPNPVEVDDVGIDTHNRFKRYYAVGDFQASLLGLLTSRTVSGSIDQLYDIDVHCPPRRITFTARR